MTDLDPDFIDAGIAAADLIADPRTWINRRVETIEMLSKEETRRRVSVDFTLSAEQQEALKTRHGVVVPISVLSKHPRRHFDLRDENGAALPALGRNDNGELALIALLSAALDALPEDPSDDLLELITADLRQIIYSNEDDAAAALSYFVGGAEAGDPARASMWDDSACNSLLRTLATDYVLFAALPADGPTRRVLKYGYGDDLPLDVPWPKKRDKYAPAELWWRAWEPDRTRFLIDCPAAWRACSFHMEIGIPRSLRSWSGRRRARFPPDDSDEAELISPTDEWASRVAFMPRTKSSPTTTCERMLRFFPSGTAERRERRSQLSRSPCCFGSDGHRGSTSRTQIPRCRRFSPEPPCSRASPRPRADI